MSLAEREFKKVLLHKEYSWRQKTRIKKSIVIMNFVMSWPLVQVIGISLGRMNLSSGGQLTYFSD